MSADPDRIVFGQPRFTDDDIAEVVDSLRAGWPGLGPKTERFEERLAELVDARHAVALNSATAGLHLSLRALGVGPGDEVITTALTFVATVSAIAMAGATPVVVDADPQTRNIDVDQVAASVTARTRAVIPVHLAGLPADLGALQAVADRHDLAIVEDAAHALGAHCGDRPVGGQSALTVFSFYATKNVAVGEGGAVTTDDPELAGKLRAISRHGLDHDAWERLGHAHPMPPVAVELGWKANMADLQAALGLHQLDRLEETWLARDRIWRHYDEALADVPVELPPDAPSGDRHGRHLYSVVLEGAAAATRDEVRARMRAAGVGTGVHYVPVHQHPYWRDRLGHPDGRFPHAERIGGATLSLPLEPHLGEAEVDRVVSAFRAALG